MTIIQPNSVTRPRVVKWYCPFADQAVFPSGVRDSINVYCGCEHGCHYCYVQGYSAASGADDPGYLAG
ncbi:MAG: hypothetical protein FWH27_06795 [Planctomycetaceae bacterium]|nr:hypothetical protein [Planctomycetaceae bacterium]